MEKKALSLGSSLIAVILSLGTIIVGKLWLSLNTTIVLLLSAAVVSCFTVIKGVKWSDIEAEISAGIRCAVPRSPTAFNFKSTKSRMVSSSKFVLSRSGNATFSKTDRSVNNAPN